MILSPNRRQLLTAGAALWLVGEPHREARANDVAIERIATIEKKLGGRVGVAILDANARVVLAHRSEEAFPLCSTFKVIAGAAILARVDAGVETLDRTISFGPADLVDYSPVTGNALKAARSGTADISLDALCAAAIGQSDNTAGNLLLGALGGPEGLTAYFRGLGDETSRLDRTEPTLNTAIPGDPRDTTSPLRMTMDLRALLIGDALTPTSRTRLEGWMVAATTGGKRLRAGLPTSWAVGDKTGSGDNATSNVVAILRPPGGNPILAAIYMTGSNQPAEARDAGHAEIGRILTGLIEQQR